jgi:hypothetical protein
MKSYVPSKFTVIAMGGLVPAIVAWQGARQKWRQLRCEIETLLDAVPVDFGGGCSVSKAHVLAWLIQRFGVQVSIDIGVYHGRSLLPQAYAHRHGTGGVAFGIDPWSREAAREFDAGALQQAIDDFVAATDYDQLYVSLVERIQALDLHRHCRLLRTTSDGAVSQLSTYRARVGLIHVDGNHDAAQVVRDVDSYLSLLAPRGFLVLDDISWASVSPVYVALKKRLKKVYERRDGNRANDYAVFWNDRSLAGGLSLRAALSWVGRS